MIEINALTFWGICAIATVGVLQAIGTLLLKHAEPKEDWKKSKFVPPGQAPEGFRWVLVRAEDE